MIFFSHRNPESTTSLIPWLPYTRLNFHYLRVLAASEISTGGNVEVPLQNPYPTTLNFWENIYSQYFLDAQSSWSITDRTETTTTESPTTVTTPSADGTTTTGPASDGTTTAGPETDGTTTAAPETDGTTTAAPENNNSTRTAVGYTFLIVSLFSLLSHLHSSWMLS